MIKKNLLRIVILFTLVCQASCQEELQFNENNFQENSPGVSADNLKTIIDSLCLPVFEGRGFMTGGAAKAADYIAMHMSQYNLKPLDSIEGYIQEFDRLRGFTYQRLEEGALSFTIERDSIKEDIDPYHVTIFNRIGMTNISAEAVFAGYGISCNIYNDYRGLNVKGKIVIIMRGEPPFITSDFGSADGVYSDFGKIATKAQTAYSYGAIGIVIVSNPTNITMYHQSRDAGIYMAEFESAPAHMEGIPDIPVFMVGHEQAGLLLGTICLADIERSIEEKKVSQGRELDMNITIKTSFEVKSAVARNVIGVIEGYDPLLKNQALIIGAHYDQDGIRKGKALPGADDNATGTAAVIELARLFSVSGRRYRHTIIFIAYDGEEPKGGTSSTSGAEYFCDNLKQHGYQPFASINLDMIGMPHFSASPPVAFFEGFIRGAEINKIYASYLPGCNTIRSICDSTSTILRMKPNYNNPFSKKFTTMLAGDHARYYNRKIPFISLYDSNLKTLHTHRDKPSRIHIRKVSRVTSLAYGIAKELADRSAPIVKDPEEWNKTESYNLFSDYRY